MMETPRAGIKAEYMYGVITEITQDHSFQLPADAEFDNHAPLDGMVMQEIPAGRYSYFTHRRPLEQLGKNHAAIGQKWFPDSVFHAIQDPVIERYRTANMMGDMDILIPMQTI